MTVLAPDEALRRERELVFEFVFVAAGEGLSPHEAVAAIGCPWTAPWRCTWHDVVLELIAERQRLQSGPAEIIPFRRVA